jgi:hypothetical protein
MSYPIELGELYPTYDMSTPPVIEKLNFLLPISNYSIEI